MCTSEGLKTPPAGLKIWCWANADYSSAPMLHHLFGVNSSGFATLLATVLLKSPVAALIAVAELVISSGLPDITIGMTHNGATPNSNYKEHYYTVWHELFHASHFSQVGEGIWGPYINYIVTHGFGYGDGTAKETTGKSICELGESWAYANQFISSGAYYRGYWFDNTILSYYNIIDSKVLTRKQMYDCLTKDIRSIDDFKRALEKKYPYKSVSINALY